MLPVCGQSTSSCEIKLRELEIDCYSKILSVFRARGNLTNERRKLLKQVGSFLNISQERHRAEVRRVTNDDLLSTIASRLTGQDWTVDWYEEGKRLVPTPTPFSHFSVNTPFADYIASVASLGKKYVDIYNSKIFEPVPNNAKCKETSETSCESSSQKLFDEINRVFTSSQEDKFKDVSIQTIKKKTLPRKCSYCERRKELRKKKLEAKNDKSTDKANVDAKDEAEVNSVTLPSGKQIIVENSFNDVHDDLSVSVIAQEIVVESEPVAGPSRMYDIADDSTGSSAGANSSLFDLATPDFSGLSVDPSKIQMKDTSDPNSSNYIPNVWDDSEMSIPQRIPRILNSGPRKKGRKQNLHSPLKYATSEDRGIRRNEIDYYNESFSNDFNSEPIVSSQQQAKYTKPSQQYPPGCKHHLSKHTLGYSSKYGDGNSRLYENRTKHVSRNLSEHSPKHHIGVLRHQDIVSKHQENLNKQQEFIPKHEVISKQHEVILKHHEGISKYPEVVPKHIDSTSKPSGGIYKHYVRVRHTPKTPKPFTEVSKYRTDVHTLRQNFSRERMESSESTRRNLLDYLPSSTDMNEYRMGGGNLPHHKLASVDEAQSIALVEPFVQELNDSQEQSVTSISFLSAETPASMTEEILISSQSSPDSEGRIVTLKDENSARKIIKIFNGENRVHGTFHIHSEQMKGVAGLSTGDYIMDDVSIVESPYPVVNGHEEIIVEEEQVLSEGDLIEKITKESNITAIVDKADTCIVPQTDMKFSVVDLTDFTGSIENIHSLSSQSKDDSRDSDIVMN